MPNPVPQQQAPLVQPGKDAPEVSKALPQNLAQVLGVKEELLTPPQEQTPALESLEIPHTDLRVGDITAGVNDTFAEATGQPLTPRYSKSGKILKWLKEKLHKQNPSSDIVER